MFQSMASRQQRLLMLRTALSWVGIVCVGTGCLQLYGQEPSSHPPPAPSAHRALLNRYCVTCHNERLKTAELLLDKMDVDNVSKEPQVWEKVVRKLRTETMPPLGAPRPDKPTVGSFLTYLEAELDRVATEKPNPGRPVVHRLNRAEYTNAIRDLLAVDSDGQSLLPAEESSYGFDNIAHVLSVSPLLAERYIAAAAKISRLAIGETAPLSVTETYQISEELLQEDRMSEDLPFGSRGGIAVRHYFPVDGEYVINVRLQRNADNYIRGLGQPHLLDVRLDGARLKLFTVGGDNRGKSGPMYSFVNRDYRGDTEQEKYEFTADRGLEVRFPAKAGPRLVQVTFLKETVEPETLLMPKRHRFIDRGDYKGGDPLVGVVGITGPYDAKGVGETLSRRKIFLCRPASQEEEEPCSKNILSALARSAYRRPVSDGDIQPLLDLYRAGWSEGGFEAGVEMALRGLLVSTGFLFRIERDPMNVPPNVVYRIGDLELASRLSFFLWSSIPDDELLDLAEGGRLKDPEVLEQQVRRMLADSRSRALMSNFAGQWLYLRNILRVKPDPKAFPDFDESLREAFHRETELFVESIAREDRSVVDLLNADYTFLNKRLAEHYGIPNIFGSHFRRVQLTDENRRGLLGQGSILTVTSYANRTTPVLRGKWVLENILGAPPPPPPPNVPALKEDNVEDGKVLTMRQRMEQHRTNPTCASCHVRMDPIGLALENFDGLGKWRTTEGGSPIDSSGIFPDGRKFQGASELRKILADHHKQEFTYTVTEKLFTYALGRGLEYYDQPAIRKILREAAPTDYRWSSLVLGIVKSTPFQMRRSREQ